MQVTEREPIRYARYDTQTGDDTPAPSHISILPPFSQFYKHLPPTYPSPTPRLPSTHAPLLSHKRPTTSIPISILNLFFSLSLHPNSPLNK